MWFATREATPIADVAFIWILQTSRPSGFRCLRMASSASRRNCYRIEEEAESRNDIEGVAERLPCYVDLLQSDVVRTGRGGEHERGYIHSQDLREMIGRDRRDAACSAGEVETFLLWPAQLSQGCLK